jgi:hypothetical protein
MGWKALGLWTHVIGPSKNVKSSEIAKFVQAFLETRFNKVYTFLKIEPQGAFRLSGRQGATIYLVKRCFDAALQGAASCKVLSLANLADYYSYSIRHSSDLALHGFAFLKVQDPIFLRGWYESTCGVFETYCQGEKDHEPSAISYCIELNAATL